MLRIAFRTFDDRGGDEITAGAFALDHATLKALPERRLVARHIDRQWQVRDRQFVRFDCGPRVMCLFEADGETVERHGPFAVVTCVDGVLWADLHALAALEQNQWCSMPTRRTWPRLQLLYDAGASLPR